MELQRYKILLGKHFYNNLEIITDHIFMNEREVQPQIAIKCKMHPVAICRPAKLYI